MTHTRKPGKRRRLGPSSKFQTPSEILDKLAPRSRIITFFYPFLKEQGNDLRWPLQGHVLFKKEAAIKTPQGRLTDTALRILHQTPTKDKLTLSRRLKSGHRTHTYKAALLIHVTHTCRFFLRVEFLSGENKTAVHLNNLWSKNTPLPKCWKMAVHAPQMCPRFLPDCINAENPPESAL